MSGHSKWATIKRQKGANDAKRAQIFTKLSNAITAAVRQGGFVSDPDSNFKLRLAVEAAKQANMPKENIERAISRAAGKQGIQVEEIIYEGFGPGGISIIVETFTDNKQRTFSELKNIFDKNGGNLGSSGSVAYQFERKGMIGVAKGEMDSDDILLQAIDGGAEDLEDGDGEVYIYTKPDELAKVREYLIDKKFRINSAELMFRPTIMTAISEKETAEKILAFMEKVEDMNDVQKVYANFDIPNDIMN